MTLTLSAFSESIQDQKNSNLAESDHIRRGWKRTHSGPIVIQNERLGVQVVWVMWEDEHGRFKYDQILRAERSGTLFLPVDTNGRFGLQKMFRPQAVDQEAYNEAYPNINFSDIGRISYELPRGFAKPKESPRDMARREVESETGGKLVSYEARHGICDNTAFSPHLTNLGSGTIDLSKESAESADPLEAILQKVEFFTQEQLRTLRTSGELYCAYTLAAIGDYLLFSDE